MSPPPPPPPNANGTWLLPAWLGRWIPGTTPGSRLRRLFSLGAAFLVALMIAEAALRPGTVSTGWVALLLSALSCLFFLVVVVAVLSLSSQNFRVAPVRLAVDTLISACFVILAFALGYRVFGFTLAENCGPWSDGKAPDFGTLDSIYFSIVTFSTLGYGDFRPCPDARLLAALEAMVGNLHLGLIVGAGFLLAGGQPPAQPRPSAEDDPEDQRRSGDGAAAQEKDGRDVHEAGVAPHGHVLPSGPEPSDPDPKMG